MQTAPVAALWREEHAYFGRLLDLLERQLDVLAAGERPDYALMLDIIEYLREYSDRYHHRREDVAFELLARRLPRLRPQLEVVWRAVTALSPVDWQAVADSVGVAFDPLFGATPRERYRELLGSLRGPQRTP